MSECRESEFSFTCGESANCNECSESVYGCGESFFGCCGSSVSAMCPQEFGE